MVFMPIGRLSPEKRKEFQNEELFEARSQHLFLWFKLLTAHLMNKLLMLIDTISIVQCLGHD
jgi:hypothetical protein